MCLFGKGDEGQTLPGHHYVAGQVCCSALWCIVTTILLKVTDNGRLNNLRHESSYVLKDPAHAGRITAEIVSDDLTSSYPDNGAGRNYQGTLLRRSRWHQSQSSLPVYQGAELCPAWRDVSFLLYTTSGMAASHMHGLFLVFA